MVRKRKHNVVELTPDLSADSLKEKRVRAAEMRLARIQKRLYFYLSYNCLIIYRYLLPT